MTNIRGDLSQAFGSVADVISALGGFFNKLLSDDNAVSIIILGILAVILATIMRMFISQIPFFRGAGRHQTNKSGTVLAWSLSILSVVLLRYQMKDNVNQFISIFAGPYSLYLITLLSGLVFYAVYKSLENHSHGHRRVWALGVALFIWLWLYSTISGTSGYLFIFIFGTVLIGGFALLLHLRRHN